ncbi:hypothetical protein DH2020_046304 [Rehmannia glutinosa]|uniref:Retrotransposon gag domain-containing protein n=1 Tax=Rehmannia glutinosa TaxID=99300 RepID=A0ABR0UCA7_REHGL
MAEGTRMKDLQEAQKKLDQILQTEAMKREAAELKLQEQINGVSSDVQDQLSGLNGKFEHLTNTLAAIQLQLLNLNKGKGPVEEESILGGPYPGYGSESTNLRNQNSPRNRLQMDQQGMQKDENKDDVMCKEEVKVIVGMDEEEKLEKLDGRNQLSGLNGKFEHLTNTLAESSAVVKFKQRKGPVEEESILGDLIRGYGSESTNRGIKTNLEIGCDESTRDADTQKVTLASMHFEGKAALWYQNFITKQGELTWQQFVEKFEELKACMLLLKSGEYSEEYFIASFISGLSEELQSFIYMFEPTLLQQTIDLGRKQLHTLEAISRKMKGSIKPYNTPYPQAKRIDLSPKEEELAYLQETSGMEEEMGIHSSSQMEEIQMSLNALAGEDGLTTMRLFGECGGHMLHILIDSGSTLSFLQEAIARRLGCKLSVVKPLLVKVANGQRLVSTCRAKGFTWTMQGHTFTYPLRLLQNEGCDMILGGDWLKSCTPIELDYDQMTFTVTLLGKRVKIQALSTEAEYGEGKFKIEPLEVVERRTVKRGKEEVEQVRVRWAHSAAD